jgi:ketosteroid isomerase-like protein
MTGSTLEHIVLQLERELFAAWGSKDIAALEPFFSEDYIGTTSDGALMMRADMMARLEMHAIQWDLLELDELAVRVYAETAIVTGRVTVSGRANETEFVRTERFTDVWIRREARWQVVVTQNTRCPA